MFLKIPYHPKFICLRLPDNSKDITQFFDSLVTRGSHWGCFMKKDFLKNFVKITGKYLSQSLFFKLKALTHLLKRDSGTGIFL